MHLARLWLAAKRQRPSNGGMKLVKYRQHDGDKGVGILENEEIVPLVLRYQSLSDILEAEDPEAAAWSLHDPFANRVSAATVDLLAPIDHQEVWAAGVTYIRSRKARMDESEHGASFYDRV